ncbi:metal ABC transporter ATP-binding protein [Labedella phragmitis]|uniref:Metal ABC transporter ATP-binding protein n=2 Tax=Labedella phragmitis TaxID=2498849 RepID=A0A3S4BIZ3_9MICO|nr:metal ABC transporter ATP-binding protein [Labedella phragmitis]
MTDDITAAVRLEGVGVRFDGTVALDDVDLDVIAASRTAIVGPNGAGKSTMLEVIAGVRPPTSGRVLRRTPAVAFVPQRAAVPDTLPLSVRDVVTIGVWGRSGSWRRIGRADRSRVDAALERLDIAALATASFAVLSGGQRQRAILAQGLARGADTLLLDEPTTGLDAASAARIRTVLEDEARRGVAVVCVSHDETLIAEAERVVRMTRGRIVEDVSAAGPDFVRKSLDSPRT